MTAFRSRFGAIEKTRVPLRIDVAFGDAVEQPAEEVTYPVLLDFPNPKIKIYRRETIIAEKYHAIADLGMANSRGLRIFTTYFLTTNLNINRGVLIRAVRANFERRKTEVPKKNPLGLTEDFPAARARKCSGEVF
jgi:hypothetical protein